MNNKLLYISLLIFLTSVFTSFGQGIKINEVSSSNSSIISDFDGDYPDWFELFNSSSDSINLSNFYITDDVNNLQKWKFPNVTLNADSLLLVFASGKDRNLTIEQWETIIREGDVCKYLVPKSTPSNEWKLLNYNDETWAMGKTGIGYGDSDDNTIISHTTTAYLRCEFPVEDINQISGLIFNVDFDDGFIAYINGVEIARENMGIIGSQAFYNTTATANHEAQLYQGNPINTYLVNNKISVLQNGKNILAIEVHNASSTSSDLSIIPFLSIGYNYTPINSRGSLDFLNFQETNLHTNFKLNSSGEFLILSNTNGEIIDSIFTREQVTDVSLGRFPNGSQILYFFNFPTPGKINIDNGFTNFLKPPIFSAARGFYETPFFLDITNHNSIGTLRYTLDGSTPNEYSSVYTNQLVISGTSVVRAKIFNHGSLPSKTTTHTYFVNQEQRLPIISLSTNPEHFFASDSGIYVLGPNAETADPNFGANFWQDWERPIHVEFFEEDNQFGFEIDLGVKIFGQWSRAHAQKSLAFYARKKYGYSEIDYQLFPNSEIKSYQNFVLRNSGNDWASTMIRDAFIGEIISPLDIDRQMYRPVVVYLNGKYWGIHNLREKINEHFIESHYGISNEDINLIEKNLELVHGEKNSYEKFYNSLNNIDMTTESAFEYINSKIDVNEFIDYYLTEIFIDNQDWPGNNIKFWQQKSTNSKWRWILYDTDFGFGIYNQYAYNQNTLAFALEKNGPYWPNPPWSTFLLRKFLQNQNFKNLFISRYSTYSNTIFLPDNINKIIDNFSAKITNEMPHHIERWGGNYSNWVSEINRLRIFANFRLPFLSQYFKSYFNLNGEYKLSITQNTEHGRIEITDFEISDSSWSGNYFTNIPIKILAIPTPEYIFSHWDGDISSTKNPLILTIKSNVNLSPVFIPICDTQIVINEINYNSNQFFNPDDWIELYNSSNKPINLSGWIFKDENPEPYFVIPENTIIDSDGYIIVCRDTLLFKSLFPDVKNYYGNFGFGLSGGGELLCMYNNNGYLIDSLTYDDKDPWPAKADGGGQTLELKNSSLDNSKYFNWKASSEYGTPGKINSVFTSVLHKKNIQHENFMLSQNYPNPFNPSTKIKYSIPFSGNVKLTVYDILGNKITTLVDEYKKADYYEVAFNSDNLPSGIYFYKLIVGKFADTKKMVLIR